MKSELRLEPSQPWYGSIGSRLWLVIGGPVFAQLLGSAFNIWYNFAYVQPLLSPAQLATFWHTVKVFNLLFYPAGVGLWVWVGLSLQQPCHQLEANQPIAPERLLQARQRVINLPWWGTFIAGSIWLLCIPIFLLALAQAPGELNPRLFSDLPISFVISALIATTHSFFIVELLSQRLLYPILFREARPDKIPGAFPLSLRWRGIFLAFCGGVCPIASLLLLTLAPHATETRDSWFAIAVGGLGIAFSLSSAWMVGQLVVEPIKEIQQVATAVAEGNLNVRIGLLRADEFGPLIHDFNHMIEELQEKQILQETFGRHVGEQAAIKILQRDPSLGGIEQELTVMFADLRNFTQRCTLEPPEKIVSMLNLFLKDMVEIVEQRHGGMVNKFLGDGFMALFGIGEHPVHHSVQAVAAAQDMLEKLREINADLENKGRSPLKMGIGIHTGVAVVGSIGSNRRLEYTAIGDTVNVAARVEALTKQVGETLLLTAATRQALPLDILTEQLPPQWVKGQPSPLNIYRIQLL
ncbi:adenylate/guanylate cyclase domain-containing protein [Kovacikia minuta CCNUW1]|uniref:adenylate/guanylate cyclase domain-containing protein n=1 Tax=Kovacikia minuta TaxID=2931930 RepID=UPI001CCDF682|nr:adenylate/guanylate cyclase domain-containing protein [Kovacikia minuta]UBF25090.1 adenylate/guanylate cyclase domain-containing protein [Kovacikia minuta CCNUW1]